MQVVIDDFTSGPLPVKLTTEDDRNSSIQSGGMLGGTRRVNVSLDKTRNRHQPLHLELGREPPADGEADGLNLTVPVDAPGGLELHYGTEGGLREDWREAAALQVDILAYTSFLKTTYSIVLFSEGGRRSRWNATFQAPPKAQVINLPFKDLRPDAPNAGVDLGAVTTVSFIFTFNGGMRIKELRVI